MNHKIPFLLAEYERQSKSATSEKSSLAHAEREFATAAEAEESFGRLKQRLLRVDGWNELSGASRFELFDEQGEPHPDKNAAVEDFVKITLPGTGKSDWVRIVDIAQIPGEEVVLTVRPSADPTARGATAAGAEKTTSHFFTDESSNNFCLERKQNRLNFYVIGLGEKANTEDTGSLLESIRNFATANVGHYFGIQKGEWTTFCENFLETEGEK